jgi:hypothetical protein
MSTDATQPGFRTPLAWLAGDGAASAPSDRGAVRDGVIDARSGAPIPEDAFRHLLAIERARADRSGRPLRLLAVSLNHGSRGPLPAAVAAKVFAGLTEAVRETDIVGWHRQDRVAAALLVERADTPEDDVARLLVERLGGVLERSLSARVVRQLRVRVVKAKD